MRRGGSLQQRRVRRLPRQPYPSLGYSIWGAAAGGGGGGPLLEEDEEMAERDPWFDSDAESDDDGDDDGDGVAGLRYLRPPAPGSALCLPEGLPQDALVSLAAFMAPADLMRLCLTSKALAGRARSTYPWLQKCLQAWDLPADTALAQLSPEARALDFAALYPDIVAWPSDIETDARRPLRRSPSTLALIQGRGKSGAFQVVDFHTVVFAGEGLGQGNRAVRATVPFPPLEDPTNRRQRAGKGAGLGGDGEAGEGLQGMWHRLSKLTRGLHLHLPPPSPSTVVPLSLAASAAAAAAAGLHSTATAAALMSSGYYYSSASAAAAAARANGNGGGSGNGNGPVFPASFFPASLSASLAASAGGAGFSGMAGSASALFSASAPASLAALMAQHMPRVPTSVTSAAQPPQQQLPSSASPDQQEEEEEDGKLSATKNPPPQQQPEGPRPFSAPWTRRDGCVEVRPRLVAYYEAAILPRDGHASASPSPAPAVVAVAPPPPLPVPVPAQEEAEPIFAIDAEGEGEEEDENELAVLLQNQQAQPPAGAGVEAEVGEVGEGEAGNGNCVAVGLAAASFPLEGYMPGWDPASFAYHSDDGGIFHGTGIKVRYYGPRFGAGDVVGCGLDYARREIFFTLNGAFLGPAFTCEGEDGIAATPLYPTVGIDSRHPVSLNFGEAPFMFDLDAYEGLRAATDTDNDGEAEAEAEGEGEGVAPGTAAAAAAAAATAGVAATAAATAAATTHVAPVHHVPVAPPPLLMA